MYWIAGGLVLAVMCLFLYRRHRRRTRYRLIAFVAMLREPVNFDPAVLARVAGKVWDADLGDGESAGEDGFVVSAEIMHTIMHDGRMFLVNCFPRPYVDDVEEAAEGIVDLRIRSLFLEHRAWFSCDAIGVDGTTSEEEVLKYYERLGKLFAELLDDNCLLIYLPDSSLSYPINDDTEAALRSSNPIVALQNTMTVPLVAIGPDDPAMKRAVEQARQEWPTFVAAFDSRTGDKFNIKAPVTYGETTEFIWIGVTSIEGERVYGELGNDPFNLGPLKCGSKVSVLAAEINDWIYFDSEGQAHGGFTVEVLQNASRKS